MVESKARSPPAIFQLGYLRRFGQVPLPRSESHRPSARRNPTANYTPACETSWRSVLLGTRFPKNPPAVCKNIGLQNRAVLEAEANRGRIMCNRRPTQLSSLAGDIAIHSIGLAISSATNLFSSSVGYARFYREDRQAAIRRYFCACQQSRPPDVIRCRHCGLGTCRARHPTPKRLGLR